MVKKSHNKKYDKYYKQWRSSMGLFWFGLFIKKKPLTNFGFWVDGHESDDRVFIPGKLPYNYVVDIFCDVVAKSKLVAGERWIPSFPQEYYKNVYYHVLPLNDRSDVFVKTLLRVLSDCKTEGQFFAWYWDMVETIKVIY